ncbi:dUTP diphosphatase [Bacillus sp. JJ722]|uniref:dUTP diphosphatase n=1 Tax=Bacillus sp. JJ722 TaxID=3122973 RepID=UPI0030009AA3
MNLKVKRLHTDAVLPQYAHEGDSGFDLVAVSDVVVEPGETVRVPTGLAFEIPPGCEIQVRPRSGITAKTKLRVQLGTIDSNFRGEVSVIVDNIAMPSLYINETYMTLGLEFDNNPLKIDGRRDDSVRDEQKYTYLIRKGDRIAQAVLAPIVRAEITEVDELEDSVRGANGFGSSGVSE